MCNNGIKLAKRNSSANAGALVANIFRVSMNRINKMRTKNFLIVLCCIVMTSMVLIIMGPSTNVPTAQESTIRSIFSQTNQQFQHLKDSVVIEAKNQLLVDDKYLTLLGYPPEGRHHHNTGTASTSNRPSVNMNSGTGGVDSQQTGEPSNNDGGVGNSIVAEEATAAASIRRALAQAGNAEKLSNFSVVSYVVANQLAAAVQLVKNLNAAVPNEHLLLYDLGLSDDDQRTLQKYCYPIINSSLLGNGPAGGSSPYYTNNNNYNMAAASGHYGSQSQQQSAHQQYSSNYGSVVESQQPVVGGVTLLNGSGGGGGSDAANTYNSYSVIPNSNASGSSSGSNLNYNQPGGPYKCRLIKFDAATNGFPSYVIDDVQMHAFRPLIIRDALHRWAYTILFLENSVRLRPGTATDLSELRRSVEASPSGVKGWWTEPTLAVSARTHQKMYEYFHTDDDNFKFLKMISLDAMFFVDRPAVNQRILLPWIKCALIPECIHPIGAQSNGCKLNKKPQYRYSGCHDYDASALNIVLGLTFSFDDGKYALDYDREALFYTESLDEAARILEQMRKNISETSDHPYTDD